MYKYKIFLGSEDLQNRTATLQRCNACLSNLLTYNNIHHQKSIIHKENALEKGTKSLKFPL